MGIRFINIECRLNMEKPILKDISIEIEKGSIYGIIGKKGSGKSSLLDVIVKKKPITKGKLILNTKNIGYASNKDIFLMDTINKELGNFNKSLKLKVLNMVGLNKYYLNLNPNDLSLSEKRLISLAKALIIKSNILLLDDITCGLDELNKKKLIRLLKELNKKYNITILVASNDVNFINLVVTHLILLDYGKIVLKGTKEEILNRDAILSKRGIKLPDIIEFTNKVEDNKKIKLGIYDDVKDLIKAVYRNV